MEHDECQGECHLVCKGQEERTNPWLRHWNARESSQGAVYCYFQNYFSLKFFSQYIEYCLCFKVFFIRGFAQFICTILCFTKLSIQWLMRTKETWMVRIIKEMNRVHKWMKVKYKLCSGSKSCSSSRRLSFKLIVFVVWGWIYWYC